MTGLAPWQNDAFQKASRAFAEGRLGHALLLVGPAHMGKQRVAEALAQRILCPSPLAIGFACGQCRSCQLFVAQRVGLATTQAHADLQRVGLEPNDKGDKLRTEITVDQVRRLGHWFSLTSQSGGAQVAIFEPADLMNTPASNALLKTLEEPSGNRFLILVTSRPGRLPATIRSRCQRVEFVLPSAEAARRWLLEEGFPEPGLHEALGAAGGNPGLAAEWMRNGGMKLREQVRAQLNAVASGHAGPIETAQLWLSDPEGDARLRFAAEMALEKAGSSLGAREARVGALPAEQDFPRLAQWFDSVNRTREQLRAPVRNDLVLAGLLREWRNMFKAAS